jgi:hypothetical protein
MGCGCVGTCSCTIVAGDGLSVMRIGDKFIISLVIDPASTAPITVGPAGIRVDCCEAGGEAVTVLVPLGSEQLVVGAVVATPTPPPLTKRVKIENVPASIGRVRMTYDGTAPVPGGLAGNGHFLNPGSIEYYDGDPTAMQFIQDGSDPANVVISYFDLV